MCLLSGVENLLVAINSKMDPRKAQIFEYLLAHILDKNFESYFDFLHVLPGAWSAYKWAALSVGQRFKVSFLSQPCFSDVFFLEDVCAARTLFAPRTVGQNHRCSCVIRLQSAGKSTGCRLI